MAEQLNGEQAIARAAIAGQVQLATGYPGSPGGGIIDILRADGGAINAHWSTNEKVAVEKAIGVAINGKKALVCVKSVGLNAMLDPLTVVNLTPLTGALVIIVGDDPGAYGSQNDQDSRLLAQFLTLPWFEPATPQDGFNLLQLSLALSQAYGLPVFMRLTRSYAQQTGPVTEAVSLPAITPMPLTNLTGPRFVPGPANAVAKNRELLTRVTALQSLLEEWDINRLYPADSTTTGLVVCGHLHCKLSQVIAMEELPQHSKILVLQSIYPLPGMLVQKFLTGLDKVIVLEENTPVIAHQLMQIAARAGLQLSWQVEAHPGEMWRWQLARILQAAFPGIQLNPAYARPVDEKPLMRSNCQGSRYGEVLDLFDAGARQLGKTCCYYGDPGCLVTVVDRLQAKYAMGGSVATVFGANLVNPEVVNIALMGDSGFFHSAIPAIADAAWHKADIALVLLNNNTARTTGGQAHPGVKESGGQSLAYREILQSCGVPEVQVVNLDDDQEELLAIVTRFIRQPGLRCLQVDIH